MKSLMRAYGLYPLTRRQGMSFSAFDDLMNRAAEELEQLQLKPYVRLYVPELRHNGNNADVKQTYLLWKKALAKCGSLTWCCRSRQDVRHKRSVDCAGARSRRSAVWCSGALHKHRLRPSRHHGGSATPECRRICIEGNNKECPLCSP